MKKFTVKSGQSINIEGESGVLYVKSIANVTEPDTMPKVKYSLTVDSILIQEGIFSVNSILDLSEFISIKAGVASVTLTNVKNASETITVFAYN